MPDDQDESIYVAIINDEEQYSIWPANRALPPGWRETGKSGTRHEVLDYIKAVWTDMRPQSVRDKIDMKRLD
jgi:MbtH protein